MQMEMRPEHRPEMMLTRKMLLSIHVLQLNIMDLRTFMRAELEENPLLEEEVTDEVPDENEVRIREELSTLVDTEVKDEDLPAGSQVAAGAVNEEKRRYLESLVTKKESLYDHLRWQLEVLAGDDEEKRIGEFIIGNLDNNGFLTVELLKMRERLSVDNISFKRALSLVRGFDPIGIGARNLKESLLMQLISSGKRNKKLCRIIYSHLEDLEKGDYEKIAKAFSISVEEVEKAKKRISRLNPRPGTNYAAEEVASIILPDVFFSKYNGVYKVEVNEGEWPRLRVSRYYKSVLKDKNAPEETKKYIKEKLSGARWLIDAVRKRSRTIMSLCEHLIEVQSEFLEKGDGYFKPLTLRDVARKLLVSDATVSRVVSNKYAQVFNRLLALKDFFSGGMKTAEGKVVSDRSIKERIRSLIEEEDAAHALSDGKIAFILKNEGINIARRTVAKYREGLDIPPTHVRKKRTRNNRPGPTFGSIENSLPPSDR